MTIVFSSIDLFGSIFWVGNGDDADDADDDHDAGECKGADGRAAGGHDDMDIFEVFISDGAEDHSEKESGAPLQKRIRLQSRSISMVFCSRMPTAVIA